MDATKKAKLEQGIVLGLLALFLVTCAKHLKGLVLFRGAGVPQQAVSTERVDLSAPLTKTLDRHRQNLESETGAGVQPATKPNISAAATARYTAQQLRDPLQSLLPDAPVVASPSETHVASAQPMDVANLQGLTVQGLWWGGSKPRAIISGHLYGVGDELQGGTITSIGRDGVVIAFRETTQHLAPVRLESKLHVSPQPARRR